MVKSLNTMNSAVMVEPQRVPGDHVVFLCGDDESAKAKVASLLVEFGWPEDRHVDLGGIAQSRGTEMFLPLWVRLYGALGTADFNVALPRAAAPDA